MIYETLFINKSNARSCWCETIQAYCLLHILLSLLLMILAQTHLTRPSCAVQSASRKKPLLPGTLFWISNKKSLNLEHAIPDARHWSISSTSSRLSNEFHGRQVGDCEQRVTSCCENNATATPESRNSMMGEKRFRNWERRFSVLVSATPGKWLQSQHKVRAHRNVNVEHYFLSIQFNLISLSTKPTTTVLSKF